MQPWDYKVWILKWNIKFFVFFTNASEKVLVYFHSLFICTRKSLELAVMYRVKAKRRDPLPILTVAKKQAFHTCRKKPPHTSSHFVLRMFSIVMLVNFFLPFLSLSLSSLQQQHFIFIVRGGNTFSVSCLSEIGTISHWAMVHSTRIGQDYRLHFWLCRKTAREMRALAGTGGRTWRHSLIAFWPLGWSRKNSIYP